MNDPGGNQRQYAITDGMAGKILFFCSRHAVAAQWCLVLGTSRQKLKFDLLAPDLRVACPNMRSCFSAATDLS